MNSLEALKRIRQETCPATYMPDFDKEECCNIIEHDLLKAKEHEKLLKIINEKNVDFRWLKVCDTVKSYNNGIDEYSNELTKEEFTTLKEIIK